MLFWQSIGFSDHGEVDPGPDHEIVTNGGPQVTPGIVSAVVELILPVNPPVIPLAGLGVDREVTVSD